MLGRVEYVNVVWVVALAGELVQIDLDDGELDSKRCSERKTTSHVQVPYCHSARRAHVRAGVRECGVGRRWGFSGSPHSLSVVTRLRDRPTGDRIAREYRD